MALSIRFSAFMFAAARVLVIAPATEKNVVLTLRSYSPKFIDEFVCKQLREMLELHHFKLDTVQIGSKF